MTARELSSCKGTLFLEWDIIQYNNNTSIQELKKYMYKFNKRSFHIFDYIILPWEILYEVSEQKNYYVEQNMRTCQYETQFAR